MIDLQELAADVAQWSREAGEIQLEYFRRSDIPVAEKLNAADIVTEADRRSETLIISRIRERFPDHSILSEESGLSEQDGSRWQWVIDPLDGTTNFYSGLPLFAVSIALEYDGVTMLGVVYAPALDELFIGVRGKGSTLNGRRIKCGTETDPARAVVSTGFPVDKNVNPDNNLDNVAAVLPHVRDLRRLGSAAIDTCYVAAGYLDGYWEMNLHRWDVSAALLIAEEAGADHGSFRADRGESVVVGSPAIFKFLKRILDLNPNIL